MANRCVIKVGGIEYEYERAMKEAGIEDAFKLYVIFLIIDPDDDGHERHKINFNSWLKNLTGVKSPNALNNFYETLNSWYNRMSSQKVCARPGFIESLHNGSNVEQYALDYSLFNEITTQDFISQAMGDKLVSEVGGIDAEYAADLDDYADIQCARQLFGYFLVIGPNEEVRFKVWFYQMTRADKLNQDRCYNSLFGWYKRVLENNVVFVEEMDHSLMRKKCVSTVGGIGVQATKRLYEKAAIKTAEQLFGKFLIIPVGPERKETFKSWLGKITQLKVHHQEECYKSLFGWYQKFFR